MKYNNYFLITIVLFILISCAKEDVQKSIIKEKSLDLQVLAAYEEGMKALNEGDVIEIISDDVDVSGNFRLIGKTIDFSSNAYGIELQINKLLKKIFEKFLLSKILYLLDL